MATSNPYSNIRFESWVDWQHVNKGLLQKLNREAANRGQIITVFSGYRNKDYNRKVGGASNSNHTRGQAVDAYIDGTPIGEVWDAATFKRLGLRSGNQPGFFNGKPDPEHVDMGAPGGGAGTTSAESPAPGSAPNGEGAGTNPDMSGQVSASDLVDESLSGAAANVVQAAAAPLPGTGLLTPTARQRYDTWQMLSQLPGASPDTAMFSQLAGYDDTNV